MYTIARIFDVANQHLRRSGGAAEKLVRTELARAFALGEASVASRPRAASASMALATAARTDPATVLSAAVWAVVYVAAPGDAAIEVSRLLGSFVPERWRT